MFSKGSLDYSRSGIRKHFLTIKLLDAIMNSKQNCFALGSIWEHSHVIATSELTVFLHCCSGVHGGVVTHGTASQHWCFGEDGMTM
jgi:hypothetical protein